MTTARRAARFSWKCAVMTTLVCLCMTPGFAGEPAKAAEDTSKFVYEGPDVYAENDSFRYECVVRGKRIKVLIRNSPFRQVKAKTGYGTEPYLSNGELVKPRVWMINGKAAVGAEREVEGLKVISEFSVWFGDRLVGLPREKYGHVCDASLTAQSGCTDRSHSVLVTPFDDGSKVLIQLGGGDGVCGYRAYWVVSEDGHVDAFFNQDLELAVWGPHNFPSPRPRPTPTPQRANRGWRFWGGSASKR